MYKFSAFLSAILCLVLILSTSWPEEKKKAYGAQLRKEKQEGQNQEQGQEVDWGMPSYKEMRKWSSEKRNQFFNSIDSWSDEKKNVYTEQLNKEKEESQESPKVYDDLPTVDDYNSWDEDKQYRFQKEFQTWPEQK